MGDRESEESKALRMCDGDAKKAAVVQVTIIGIRRLQLLQTRVAKGKVEPQEGVLELVAVADEIVEWAAQLDSLLSEVNS